MKEIQICENCGANTEYYIKYSTQGFFCNQCKWSLVTTYIPKIVQDRNKYKVYLLSADTNNKKHIKALAKIANINFLQARKMAQDFQPLIIESEATTVQRAKEIFENLAIEYKISPNFPY